MERDVAPAPRIMTGFPTDGGLVTAGVTVNTVLGLSAVARCLDILSNGVSQLPWDEKRGNLILPPSRLVLKPLDACTRREWTSYVVSSLALYDVSYLLKVGGTDAEGVPMGLWPAPPDFVSPIAYDSIPLMPFVQPEWYFVGQKRVHRDDLVILRRSPTPSVSDTLGGILRLARIKFAEAIAADGYASRYWQGGGHVNSYLATDAMMTPPQAQERSDRWAERRAHGPDYIPVMDAGLKLEQTGADPTQQTAVEARKELVADIGRYFGIPTHQLNAPQGDSETYSSTESSNQDLVRYTLSNHIYAIQDAISDQLPRGRSMVMNPRQLTVGTFLARAQAYQLLTGNKAVFDVQEARDDFGLPPLENPDELNPPASTPVVALPTGGQENG